MCLPPPHHRRAGDDRDQRVGQHHLTGDAKPASATSRVGSFVSGILDAQAMVDWDRVTMQADMVSGSALTVRVRTGGTAVPDATWSSWRAVASGGSGRRRFSLHPVPLGAGE